MGNICDSTAICQPNQKGTSKKFGISKFLGEIVSNPQNRLTDRLKYRPRYPNGEQSCKGIDCSSKFVWCDSRRECSICPSRVRVVLDVQTAPSYESRITSVLSERPLKSADPKTERGKILNPEYSIFRDQPTPRASPLRINTLLFRDCLPTICWLRFKY